MKTIACCAVTVFLAGCQPSEIAPVADQAAQRSTPVPPLKPVQPTRTKAVRIFVVTDDVASDAKRLGQFVEERRAAVNDVFIVGGEARAYVDGRLLPVSQAMQANWEAIPAVDLTNGEQLQWQSEADFTITGIEKVKEKISTRRPPPQGNEKAEDTWSFETVGNLPDNPFPRLSGAKPIAAVAWGDSGEKTIRTGAYDLSRSHGRQLYLLSATITTGSEPRKITPGLYVFACSDDELGKDEECHRRVGPATVRPNRTKVVRLVLVPDAMRDEAEILKLAETHSLSTCDALIVRGVPMYYHRGKLVDHETALHENFSSAAVVMVEELEQLQWESNTAFNLQAIEIKPGPGAKPIKTIRRIGQREIEWEFEQRDNAPKNPFDVPINGPMSRTLRSGVVRGFDPKNRAGQLYKVTFTMMIDGKRRRVDPDVVCDMS